MSIELYIGEGFVVANDSKQVATGPLATEAGQSQPVNHLAGPTRVSVDATAGGKTLATLLGAALNASLKRSTLIPASTGVYWASGVPTTASSEMPETGVELPIDKTQADTLKFITAAGTVSMDVYQEG